MVELRHCHRLFVVNQLSIDFYDKIIDKTTYFQVVDLLNPNSYRPLLVRWSKNRGFYVENLFTIQCESIDDLMAVLDEGW